MRLSRAGYLADFYVYPWVGAALGASAAAPSPRHWYLIAGAFVDAAANFGVTTPIWDRVFATAPARDRGDSVCNKTAGFHNRLATPRGYGFLSTHNQEIQMNAIKSVSLAAAIAAIGFTVAAPGAQAAIAVNVDLGPAPVCPYGYYDTSPYACAPYGYYGPEWFVGGVFLGAGPWFHGAKGWRGHVDRRLDARLGYRGRLPERGERADAEHSLERMEHFAGNEMREGGHFGGHRR